MSAHAEPFERLVEEHGALVMRVCRALLAPADAEDAWGETFLAALRAYPRLAPDSDARGWLVTIAHRKAVDHLRSRTRRAVPVADPPEVAVRDDPAVPRDTALWDALAALPFKQRAAVAYHYVGDLPYAEVGVLLGTTAEAARRSAADGIARLRATYRRRAS